MHKYFSYFGSKLYSKENGIYPDDCVEINNNAKEEQILNKKNIKDKEILEQVESLINEIDNIKDPNNTNIKHKKNKIKKMKS